MPTSPLAGTLQFPTGQASGNGYEKKKSRARQGDAEAACAALSRSPSPPGMSFKNNRLLAAQAKFRNHLLVGLRVALGQIHQVAAAGADQLEQAAAR